MDSTPSTPSPTSHERFEYLTASKLLTRVGTKVFKLHAKAYRVMAHIDDTPPPPATDPTFSTWEEIDSAVLQWIYGSVSDELLVRILHTPSTAHAAWTRLAGIFLNNKGSRAAALEQEFNNLTLQAMPSLDIYCQRLKDLSDQRTDVDCPVTDNRLVLQLVRGLPAEFDSVGSLINQNLPAWEVACSMLQLENNVRKLGNRKSPPPSWPQSPSPTSTLPPTSLLVAHLDRPANLTLGSAHRAIIAAIPDKPLQEIRL